MSDQELKQELEKFQTELDNIKRELDHTQRGAAALGLCIARALAKSDPTLRQQILDEIEVMNGHFSLYNQTAAMRALSNFVIDIGNPETNLGLSPTD